MSDIFHQNYAVSVECFSVFCCASTTLRNIIVIKNIIFITPYMEQVPEFVHKISFDATCPLQPKRLGICIIRLVGWWGVIVIAIVAQPQHAPCAAPMRQSSPKAAEKKKEGSEKATA